MKRLLLALALLGTLFMAAQVSLAQAYSPTWPGRDYARVKLWTGSDCGTNSGCQFVTRNNVTGETRIVAIGSLTTNGPQTGGNCTWLYIYPSQSYACNVGFYFVSNAWTDYWAVYEGDSITAYARQPCPTTGAYHYSELKPFYQPHDPSGIAAEWLGSLTIQSGCQTQGAVSAVVEATKNLTGTYRMAKSGGHARMRNLLKANCFPATDKLDGPWACPERHP